MKKEFKATAKRRKIVINTVFKIAKKPSRRWWIEPLLACHAVPFVGKKYTCPCCQWSVRAFTHGGSSFKVRDHGYCPRCNAKARHRRIWLYLQEQTNLFSDRLRLLHVSPKYAISRRLRKLPNLDYVGIDIAGRPNVCMRMDVSALSFRPNTFDAIICVHVLEHVEDDRKAFQELFRVLKPGGWALISVPIRLSQKTFEDPAITAPEERRRAFGEEQHVRFYGYDLTERLEQSGFQVELDLAQDIDPAMTEKYGLLDDENIFHCRKL